MGTTRKSAIETKINNRYISNRGWSQKVILQNLFLTVIKTTGTNEEKVFYSMRYVDYLQVVARS